MTSCRSLQKSFLHSTTLAFVGGSIFMLMTHAKDDLINHTYVDELIIAILHKWDNYDCKLKVAIYDFAVALDVENADTSAVTERIVAFRRALNKVRTAALRAVNKSKDAQEPIVNRATILAALLKALQHTPATKKKPTAVQIEKAIFAGEGKYAKCWQPFDPFPQYRPSEEQKHLPNKAGTKSYASAADILGEANFQCTIKALLMAPGADDLLEVLAKANNFNSTQDYLSLASFAGFGRSSAEIAESTSLLLNELLKRWSVSGDEAEQQAIVSLKHMY
ncbi:hypothetical protein MHU86_4999 [Fragilaria crotonensis]|nr:hypothetical protein MHU86_4999 [Fragilaria crotonensis]